MNHSSTTNLKTWIEHIIRDFIQQSPENSLQNSKNEKAWDNVLVGYSSGSDPLYDAYKEHVGSFHWTPLEIFSKAFPDSDAKQDELTVISWILPQREITKDDNRKETFYPSERWARARIFGEQFNNKIKNHLVDSIKEKGYRAVAPSLFPEWAFKQSEKFVFSSNWSERHAAHAAGLGTFGLCDGLITPVGKAMRVGSVVSQMNIPATPRPYENPFAYCLFLTQGICGKCIARCPVGAISESGHDKIKCMGHLRPGTMEYVKTNYKFDGYGCGLCQTGVPCESKIPMKQDVV